MRMIKDLESKRDRSGRLRTQALFFCDVCGREAVKQKSAGMTAKSCGCARPARRAGGSIPKASRIDYAEAARMYAEGMSTNQVADALGTSGCTVHRALKTLGVPRRKLSESISLRHRGSRRKGKDGYVVLRVDFGVRKKEHVHIAEQVLGRQLKCGEMVHHINGDRSDNRNCNLLICTTSYHTWLHWKMAQIQRKEMNNEYAKPTVGIDSTQQYQRRLDR